MFIQRRLLMSFVKKIGIKIKIKFCNSTYGIYLYLLTSQIVFIRTFCQYVNL